MNEHQERRFPEELANTVTHGAGLVLSSAGLVALMALALGTGKTLHIASAAIYGTTLIALYVASTLFHFTANLRRRYTFRLLDHCAIYLLIAGSYTPIALIVMPAHLRWPVFALSWLIAAVGIATKLFGSHRATMRSNLAYLAAGWMCLLVLKPLYDRSPPMSFGLLVAGGFAYTVGVWFFVHERRPFHHAIWHLFVMTGSACHFAAIYLVLAA